MKKTTRMFVVLIAAVACTVVGCGDPRDEVPMNSTTSTVVDDGPNCGQGTYEKDGMCVPEEQPDVKCEEPDVKPAEDTKSDYECQTEKDCNDGDSCTTESCVNGKCYNKPKTCDDGFVCNEMGDCVKVPLKCENCNDGNACTMDSCNVETGKCQHGVKSCDDNNPKTADSCDTVSGDCHHQLDCGPCWDDDPCTKDTCGDEGVCMHDPLQCPDAFKCVSGTCVFSCSQDSQCGDNNICTTDSCDVASGECVNTPHTCDDGDETTVDLCVPQDAAPGWTCEFIATECTGGCDDENKCTMDGCQAGKCVFLALPCGQGAVCDSAVGECIPDPTLCYGTADCDDGSPCTDDSCEFGSCLHEKIQCGSGEACDAGTGNCVKLEGPDCPPCDDGDPATLDFCSDGKCQHSQPVGCDAGTVLNPETGLCEVAVAADPTCEDGEIACQQFEVNKMIVYALCADNNWFAIENCGKLGGDTICIEGQGCTPIL